MRHAHHPVLMSAAAPGWVALYQCEDGTIERLPVVAWLVCEEVDLRCDVVQEPEAGERWGRDGCALVVGVDGATCAVEMNIRGQWKFAGFDGPEVVKADAHPEEHGRAVLPAS